MLLVGLHSVSFLLHRQRLTDLHLLILSVSLLLPQQIQMYSMELEMAQQILSIHLLSSFAPEPGGAVARKAMLPVGGGMRV